MFFEISKFVWLLFKPSHLLIWLAFFGLLLCFTRFARFGRWVGILSLVGLVVIANLQLGSSSIRGQENAVEPLVIADAPKPDGILVLSGAVNRRVTESRGGLQVHGNADRILEMIRLMSLFPEAKIVYSGGWSDRDDFEFGEADYVKRYMKDLPFDLSRVTFESRSRNTRENIRFSKELVKPQEDERWWLVTSAQHVPRALAEAKSQGWTLEGYPVDYLTTREETETPKRRSAFSNLAVFNHSVYELLGRAAYALTR